jgi:hypothetical protein
MVGEGECWIKNYSQVTDRRRKLDVRKSEMERYEINLAELEAAAKPYIYILSFVRIQP